MCSTYIQTAIKIRPFIDREKSEKLEALWRVEDKTIVQIDGLLGEPYCFDHIFDESKTNKDIYGAVVKPLVMSCLVGINSTIFAYGQTASEKTHAMWDDRHSLGIINFTVEDIFSYVRKDTERNFLLRCSCLEVFNEKVNDLLDTNAKDVEICEDYNTQAAYAVVKQVVVRTSAELLNLIRKARKTRKIGCTDMNKKSSRSHTIFKLVIRSQQKESKGSYTESTLNLVDLADTERVGQMNKSLKTLKLVIRKLSENESDNNYRDSKLTRLFRHSLGGNSKTLIIATITLAASKETKSTLEFAQRAKYVKNRPIINKVVTDKGQLKQCRNLWDYRQHIEKLKREITAKRDTRAHYQEHNENFALSNIEELEENNDEEITPVKSELCFGATNTNDTETPLIDDSICSSAYNSIVSKQPNSPKTSSALRLLHELLEESYILKTFKSLEKQLQGKSNVNDVYIKFIEDNDDMCKKVLLLQTILEVKPFEEQGRKSLDTIIQEDTDLFNKDLDLSIGSNQIEENDNKKLNKEDIIIKLHEENQGLRNEIDAKNAIIDQLKRDILQDKSANQAKLEILNDKIKKFNYYKEEMQEKLSELQKETKMLKDNDCRNEYLVLNEENCRLKAELQDSLDRLSEEKKELESLSEELAKKNRDVDSLKAKISSMNETNESLTEKTNKLEKEVHLFHKKNDYMLRIVKQMSAKRQDFQRTISPLLKKVAKIGKETQNYKPTTEEGSQDRQGNTSHL